MILLFPSSSELLLCTHYDNFWCLLTFKILIFLYFYYKLSLSFLQKPFFLIIAYLFSSNKLIYLHFFMFCWPNRAKAVKKTRKNYKGEKWWVGDTIQHNLMLHIKGNVDFRVYMYQNVQKVSRTRAFGCQRRFECLRVVGRVVGTKAVQCIGHSA